MRYEDLFQNAVNIINEQTAPHTVIALRFMALLYLPSYFKASVHAATYNWFNGINSALSIRHSDLFY